MDSNLNFEMDSFEENGYQAPSRVLTDSPEQPGRVLTQNSDRNKKIIAVIVIVLIVSLIWQLFSTYKFSTSTIQTVEQALSSSYSIGQIVQNQKKSQNIESQYQINLLVDRKNTRNSRRIGETDSIKNRSQIFDQQHSDMDEQKQMKIHKDEKNMKKESSQMSSMTSNLSQDQISGIIQKLITSSQAPKKKTQNVPIIKAIRQTNINQMLKTYSNNRINHYSKYFDFYNKNYNNEMQEALESANITQDQYLDSVSMVRYATESRSAEAEQIFQKELEYYQAKYQIDQYKELPFCIVVPTFKNVNYFRYYYNLHTILQQNYSNYQVIIIDDASNDGTGNYIEAQLQKLDPVLLQRVKFFKNKERRQHMENIYMVVSKLCQKGEIFMVVDGDDQLIGRQVLKLFNAAYHQTKSMSIYSNHLRIKKETTIMIGISLPYPDEVKANNSYRRSEHYYSHLKSAWVDLFLEIDPSYLKDSDGRWFTNAVDNAIFLSIFQLSCQRVFYLPEITYKYNYFTGNNVYNINLEERLNASQRIRDLPPLDCVKIKNRAVFDRIQGYYS